MAQRLQNYEQRDDAVKEQHNRMNAQLANAEAWGTGQQDLLYRIRQQVNVVFELLQGTDRTARAPAALPIETDLRRLPSGDQSLRSPSATEHTIRPMRVLPPATEKTGT